MAGLSETINIRIYDLFCVCLWYVSGVCGMWCACVPIVCCVSCCVWCVSCGVCGVCSVCGVCPVCVM